MTALAAPSPDRQRFRALEQANEIRIRRAKFKRSVRSGEAHVETVLREPEWFLLTAPVHEVLGWSRHMGASRVNRVLRRADVWPLRPVGRLTVRQRERILAGLATR